MQFRSITIWMLLAISAIASTGNAQTLGVLANPTQTIERALLRMKDLDVTSADFQRLLQTSEGDLNVFRQLLQLEESDIQARGEQDLIALGEAQNLAQLGNKDAMFYLSPVPETVHQFFENPTAQNWNRIITETRRLGQFIPKTLRMTESGISNESLELLKAYSAFLGVLQKSSIDEIKSLLDYDNGYDTDLLDLVAINFSSENTLLTPDRPFVDRQILNLLGNLAKAFTNSLSSHLLSQKEAMIAYYLQQTVRAFPDWDHQLQRQYMNRLGSIKNKSQVTLAAANATPFSIYLIHQLKARTSFRNIDDAIVREQQAARHGINTTIFEDRIESQLVYYKAAVEYHNAAPTYGKVGFICLPEFPTTMTKEVRAAIYRDFYETQQSILFYLYNGVQISHPERPLPSKKMAVLAFDLLGSIAAYPNEFEKIRSLTKAISLFELSTTDTLSKILNKAMYPSALRQALLNVLANSSDPLLASVRIEVARALKAPTPDMLAPIMKRFGQFKTHNPEPEFGYQ